MAYSNITIQISTGLSFIPGQFIQLIADNTNYIVGQVVSYDSITGVLTFTPTTSIGSGEFCDWDIVLSGAPGIDGSSGNSGSSGSSGSSGINGTSGTTGTSGTSGTSGIDGLNGISSGRLYYFNQSEDSDISGYKVLSEIPVINGLETVTTVLAGNQQNALVQQFMTPELGFTVIPAGIQQFKLYYTIPTSATDVDTYLTIELANSAGIGYGSIISSFPFRLLYNDNTPIETLIDVAFPSAGINLDDRIIVKLYLNNQDSTSRTIIWSTEDGLYSYVISSVGVISGTSGTSGSSGSSGVNGTSGSSGSSGTSGVSPTISGTLNYVAKYTPSGSALGISQIFDNGTNVGIGTTTFTDSAKLVISGRVSQIDLGLSTFFGFEAGKSDDLSGNINTAFGYQAMKNTIGSTLGYQNSAFGAFALLDNTNGWDNAAFGRSALQKNTTGYQNTAIAGPSLFNNTTGFRNTAVGWSALLNMVNGYENVAVGYNAAQNNISGIRNVYIGVRAGESNSSGSHNVIIGSNSDTISTAIINESIFIGSLARANANGQVNQIVIGYNVIGEGSNTTAIGNTSTTLTRLYGQLRVNIINNGVGNFITTSATGVLQQRTAAEVLSDIGGGSGNYVTIDTTQTITGAKTFSLDNVINGVTVGRGGGNINSNTAVGYQALLSNTTGGTNTANGVQALRSNTTGVNNTANGFQALYFNTTGINNTANGVDALLFNTTGSNNTANGVSALRSNTTGANNTANGRDALYSNTTGANNTANGVEALLSNTTGNGNTANGSQALRSNTTGVNNTANGFQAGRYIANKATAATILNNSVMIGWRTSPLADDQTNQIVIGYDATGAGSNTATLGNTSIVKTILRGTINASNLPTSSAGLITGDIWNDGGTLKIV